MTRPPPISTLFPYTTLFRSGPTNGLPRSFVEGTLFTSENAEGSDRKSTRLNSSHITISYAVFCLKKKKHQKVHADLQPATSALIHHGLSVEHRRTVQLTRAP